MTAIRGVAFDLEGTVVDLEKHHHAAHVASARVTGAVPDVDFELLKAKVPHFIGGGDQAVAEGISYLSGGKVSAADIRAAKMHQFTMALHDVRVAPRPGFAETLKKIRKAELPTAIASLTDIDVAKLIFRKSGINKLFPEEMTLLLYDVEHGRKKPAPDVYLKAAHRMGIKPSEMLVFEDSPTGIEAAKAAGAIVVAMPIYRSKDAISEIVNAGVNRIFLDWREINVVNLLNNLREE